MTELLRDHTANLRGGVACCLARLADRGNHLCDQSQKRQ